MNAIIGRLLQNIPSAYDTGAYDVASLAITGPTGSSITLSDLTLYIATPALSATIDLHGQTVSQVAALMPNGVTATVLQDGPAELLLYSDGSGAVPSGQLPVTLTIATSPLWQLLAAISRTLTNREKNITNTFAQVNVRVATGMWLQWWGASLGIPAYPGEPDSFYCQRLIASTLAPNCNNVAIEQFFNTLGYQATVVDTAPGSFTVNVQMPIAKSTGYVTNPAYFSTALQDVKASGIVATIVLNFSLADSAKATDSVNNIVITPGAGQLWGSGRKWGQNYWFPPTVYTPPSGITVTASEVPKGTDNMTANVTTPPYRWGTKKWGQSVYHN